MSNEPVTILLAEDDEGHASLIRRNLTRAGVTNGLIHVRDGQEALDFIRRQGAYTERPEHGSLLVLLDIKMPRVDGIEVLRQIKRDPATSQLPVIMLTTTDDPREIARCYQLGCGVYITKPVQYEEFAEAMKRLGLFLNIVKVPQKGE